MFILFKNPELNLSIPTVLEENIPTDIPTFINVAVNGTASSSSVGWGGVASRVIDGNRNGMWGG